MSASVKVVGATALVVVLLCCMTPAVVQAKKEEVESKKSAAGDTATTTTTTKEKESGGAVKKHTYVGRISGVPRETLLHFSARVAMNGGEFVAYTRDDGTFVLYGLEPGTHLLDIALSGYMFPPIRIDIGERKGRIQTKVNDGSGKVIGVSNARNFEAVTIEARGKHSYYVLREKVNPLGFLMNPMVLITLVTLGLTQFSKLMPQGEMKATMREMSEKMSNVKESQDQLKRAVKESKQ